MQTITITGVTGGFFRLWVQDMYPTTELTFSSTPTQIQNALTAAASELAGYGIDVECTSFSVVKALTASNTALQLNITFLVNNRAPLSPTTAYVDDLTGMFGIGFVSKLILVQRRRALVILPVFEHRLCWN